jgi:hypothetical protein
VVRAKRKLGPLHDVAPTHCAPTLTACHHYPALILRSRALQDSVAHVSVFEPYSAAWWKKRAAVATNPESATASGASNLQ